MGEALWTSVGKEPIPVLRKPYSVGHAPIDVDNGLDGDDEGERNVTVCVDNPFGLRQRCLEGDSVSATVTVDIEWPNND
jgi:hypothetical protein